MTRHMNLAHHILPALRDTLLPKLMRGEVRVKTNVKSISM